MGSDWPMQYYFKKIIFSCLYEIYPGYLKILLGKKLQSKNSPKMARI